jgi:hypothetical protein
MITKKFRIYVSSRNLSLSLGKIHCSHERVSFSLGKLGPSRRKFIFPQGIFLTPWGTYLRLAFNLLSQGNYFLKATNVKKKKNVLWIFSFIFFFEKKFEQRIEP